MFIFRAKIADNLYLRMFLIVFFMSKVGSHVDVDGYDICFAIDHIFLNIFASDHFGTYISLRIWTVSYSIKYNK